MPDALELSISDLAANDLEEISRFSTEQWGEDQALRYVEKLYEVLHRLTRFPLSGHTLEGPKLPTRASLVESHVLIYQITNSEVQILRIVHERRMTRLLLKSL
jgi:plasmid stabilization system protein ParE